MAIHKKYSLLKQDLDANNISLQCLTPWDAETIDWTSASVELSVLQDSWNLVSTRVVRLSAVTNVWVNMDNRSPIAVAEGAGTFYMAAWATEYFSIKPLQDTNWDVIPDWASGAALFPTIACIGWKLNVTLMY